MSTSRRARRAAWRLRQRLWPWAPAWLVELVRRYRRLIAPQQAAVSVSSVPSSGPRGYVPPVGLIPWFNPLTIEVLSGLADRPRLNVLLPCVAMNYMSGGPNTAVNIGDSPGGTRCVGAAHRLRSPA